MKRKRKYLFAIILTICMLMFATQIALAGTVTWRVTGTQFIRDENNVNLQADDYIQLWDVGNQALLGEAVIGDGFLGPGQFSKVLDDLAPGTYTLNIRAYNVPKAQANDPGACSGVSTSQTIVVTQLSIETISFVGFQTTTCPSDPTAIKLMTFSAGNESNRFAGVGIVLLLVSITIFMGAYVSKRKLTVKN